MNVNNNTAVLVLSCDAYADIWPTFFDFFDKYWSNCPFPVYLGTNSKVVNFKNVTQLFSQRKTTWSDELNTLLQQIPQKYVILILEDYFINKPVDNNALFNIINYMETNNAAYTQLAAFPKKYNQLWNYDTLPNNSALGEIKKGSKYRVNLQIAVWNKTILQQLIKLDENPWQFEPLASERSNALSNPFYIVLPTTNINIVHGPIPYLCTAVTNGMWMRNAIKLCKQEGIAIDTSHRKTETATQAFYRSFYIALPISLRRVVDYVRSKF
jgi:hypothetical protein